MNINRDNLSKKIKDLINQKSNAKRSMQHWKDNKNEQALYQKFKTDYRVLDVEIGELVHQLKELDNEFDEQQRTIHGDNETKIGKLIKYINEGSKGISGNDIKREAILETLDIITYALEQLNEEE